jgi:endonuclease-3
MKTEIAVRQLKEIKKYVGNLRLAAEWPEKWQILISTILSAQTRDELTIRICESLFKKYNSPNKIARARLSEIQKIIRPVNYYKTKSKNIKKTARLISENGIPTSIEGLLELPGVGRKVANVYLAEAHNKNVVGVDTHVARLSRKMGWTKNWNRHKIEKDLENLFPKRYWRSINYILVRFGRTYWTRKRTEDSILEKIKGSV